MSEIGIPIWRVRTELRKAISENVYPVRSRVNEIAVSISGSTGTWEPSLSHHPLHSDRTRLAGDIYPGNRAASACVPVVGRDHIIGIDIGRVNIVIKKFLQLENISIKT